MSALLSSASAPASSVESATPMLADTRTSVALSTNGWSSPSTKDVARVSTSAIVATPSSRMANSSPPSRATVSEKRVDLTSRWAIAGVVAERVVDVLEVIEVEEHHRDLMAPALRERQGMLDSIAEQVSICKQCQRVMKGQLSQLFLERLALGDVTEIERQSLYRGVRGKVAADDLEHVTLRVAFDVQFDRTD